MAQRPDLTMREQSKEPANPGEAAVRETLSQQYDPYNWTIVCTTTLLTADDAGDGSAGRDDQLGGPDVPSPETFSPPRRSASEASKKRSRSPSRTPWALPVSTFVRRSLTI
ncbi:MAG: hypothetical protein CFH10_01536 [Alphaproteobacteria bacterium MarineAlpha4_Bin2]|nr:MAG: hypothetical protein CFH10_01536 [Alphaproteobacteria bacterium MarineAlpha4_Bin2]